MKKMNKTDLLFLLAIIAGIGIYLFTINDFPTWQDESFYSTIALRLINGDSLVTDEWHLSQFSAVFLYIPVRIWLAIKGSTDGIILFLRCVYLAIHAGCATGIYAFFRKKGIWAIAAAFVFFTQIPMRIMTLSYNSLFALFLIALGLLLLTVYEKQKPVFYILSGISYACACVCNPIFCAAIFVYLSAFLVFSYIHSEFHRENIVLSNRERKKRKKKLRDLPQKTPAYTAFFTKKALLLFMAGVGIAAAICIVFFFAAGGTLSGLAQNFKHLLTDSEHNVFNSPFAALWNKIKEAAKGFNTISLHLFLIPIVLFAALAADRKRKENSHRIIFVLISVAVCLFYVCSIAYTTIKGEENTWFFSYPLFILSLASYILTQNKNKPLFYCAWLPCILAAISQFLASNLSLLSIGWVIAIANIAGVFFIMELFSELHEHRAESKEALVKCARACLCVGICLQLAFHLGAVVYGSPRDTEAQKRIENGPYAGLNTESRLLDTYQQSLADLDIVKEMSAKDDSVLILSDMTWLYLYIDRPFGSYSAWQLSFEPNRLKAYYELNTEKVPKYIYISAVVPRSDHSVTFSTAEDKAYAMRKIFDCKTDRLARGILLTVKGFKE